MACRITLVVVCAVLVGTVDEGAAQPGTPAAHPDIRLFFQAAQEDKDLSEEALEQIAASWRDGYAAIIRDMMRLMQPHKDRHGPLVCLVRRTPIRRSS